MPVSPNAPSGSIPPYTIPDECLLLCVLLNTKAGGWGAYSVRGRAWTREQTIFPLLYPPAPSSTKKKRDPIQEHHQHICISKRGLAQKCLMPGGGFISRAPPCFASFFIKQERFLLSLGPGKLIKKASRAPDRGMQQQQQHHSIFREKGACKVGRKTRTFSLGSSHLSLGS